MGQRARSRCPYKVKLTWKVGNVAAPPYAKAIVPSDRKKDRVVMTGDGGEHLLSLTPSWMKSPNTKAQLMAVQLMAVYATNEISAGVGSHMKGIEINPMMMIQWHVVMLIANPLSWSNSRTSSEHSDRNTTATPYSWMETLRETSNWVFRPKAFIPMTPYGSDWTLRYSGHRSSMMSQQSPK